MTGPHNHSASAISSSMVSSDRVADEGSVRSPELMKRPRRAIRNHVAIARKAARTRKRRAQALGLTTLCRCGEPRRPGQFDCKACHAKREHIRRSMRGSGVAREMEFVIGQLSLAA